MSNEDSNMEPVAQHLNVPENIAGNKKQAVIGPQREQIDDMRSKIQYLEEKIAYERQRRREAEKGSAEANAEAVRMETEKYVGQFERQCTEFYARESEALKGQLQAVGGELRLEKQKAGETSAALAAQEKELIARQTEHEKQLAEKSTEVLALMAKLRPARPFAPSAEQTFPPNNPPLHPQFVSPTTLRTRALEKVIKTSSRRIPTIPLQPAASGSSAAPQLADEILNFDAQSDASVSLITDLIRQVLSELGVGDVQIKGRSKKGRRAPTKLSMEVKQQQAKITEHEDLFFKRALREVWRHTYATSTAEDFRAYVPVAEQLVQDCNDGGPGPASDDYSLDFSEGFMLSLWNKQVVKKLAQSFLAARRASGNGWGLPDVSLEYIQGELYGQLKRCQQSWAIWQPRFSPQLNGMETPEQVRQRVEGHQAARQVNVNSRASKDRKYKRRVGTVRKVVEIKAVQNSPDLEFWKLLKKILGYLDVGGMSSEDGAVREFGGVTVQVYLVKLCLWRAPTISDYLHIIDNTAKTMQSSPTRALPRLPAGKDVFGRSAPPKGLPEKMYDAKWLADKRKASMDYVEELEISKDAFEFMVAATSSLVS